MCIELVMPSKPSHPLTPPSYPALRLSPQIEVKVIALNMSTKKLFLPCPGHCKQCCDEHWDTCVFLKYGFLRVNAQQWDCWAIQQYNYHMLILFLFFKEPAYYSPQRFYQIAFLSAVQEGSLFSTFSPAYTVCRFFDDGHSDQCEVIYTADSFCYTAETNTKL